MTKQERKGKVAFVKFGGLAAGGTEKYLQIIAANIPKDKYDVDYFYCDAAPYIGSDWKHPDTDPARQKFMEDAGVNLIHFYVAAKDVTTPTHVWKSSNFFDLFNEDDYDLVMTGRAGHPEYPFTEIKNTPIVDSIHLAGMVDNQPNIAKVIHISNQNAQTWAKAGGNPNKVEIIYPPVVPPKTDAGDLRNELGIQPDDFVYGLHQRDNEEIFSEWPIGAFAEVQKLHPEVHFVLLGGAKKHLAQGADLKNFHHVAHTGDINRVWDFLRTLDVYLHGRRDGEINSQAIAEAMRCGLPVISHPGANNGHVETIGDAGSVHDTFPEYVKKCLVYKNDADYLQKVSRRARNRFDAMYDLDTNIGKIVKIFDRILEDKIKDEKSDDDFWGDMWDD